ncbi:hypothetical protein D3C78_1365100 [compost metagenome]
MRDTKARSIFTLSKVKSRRRPRLDWPVPKSSSEMRTPALCNSLMMRCAVSADVMTAVSVISSSSRCGSRPTRERMDRILSAVLGSINCAEERLKDRKSSRGQNRAASAAFLSRASDSASMKPRSSASGTKTAGDTKPRSGSFQRASASKPMTFASSSLTMGWKCTSIASVMMALRNACSSWVARFISCAISRE